jgi:adiponectin receptor
MRFDYAGINVLIPGSTFPPVYYGLYCNLPLATFYLGLMSSIAITIFTMCLFDWIHKE